MKEIRNIRKCNAEGKEEERREGKEEREKRRGEEMRRKE
jgi:hypothetical protein